MVPNTATRPETLDQAHRCDVQKSRAIARGLCDKCAGQYAWGLQVGFTHSRPPCSSCAVILAATPGETRPNGWVNMRLRNLGTDDTGQLPHAHPARPVTPEKRIEGYGECQCGTFWTGFETCHCAGCHRTFLGERAFAKHRVGGSCRDPRKRGLVEVIQSRWKGWGFPAQRDRLKRSR